MNKQILVAVDGSVYSSNSLDYLIRLFRNNNNLKIDLIGTIQDKNCKQKMSSLHPQAKDIEHHTCNYLQDARARLLRNGFHKDQVAYYIQASPSTTASSIHSYAQQGNYDGLLVGRRGVGKMGEIFMGSVSADLIKKCHDVPVWIIDGDVTSTRFLLAAHSSSCSLMAADHLAFILYNNPKTKIYIYHSSAVFGSPPPALAENFHYQWGEQWCNQHLDLNNYLYHAHTRVLLENGISRQQIIHIAPHKDFDASHDLLRQANKYDCGTIVIGRRGREAVKGFMGGVSDRTTQYAHNLAVWLVG